MSVLFILSKYLSACWCQEYYLFCCQFRGVSSDLFHNEKEPIRELIRTEQMRSTDRTRSISSGSVGVSSCEDLRCFCFFKAVALIWLHAEDYGAVRAFVLFDVTSWPNYPLTSYIEPQLRTNIHSNIVGPARSAPRLLHDWLSLVYPLIAIKVFSVPFQNCRCLIRENGLLSVGAFSLLKWWPQQTPKCLMWVIISLAVVWMYCLIKL